LVQTESNATMRAAPWRCFLMLQLTAAGKRFGPRVLFENADWLITPDERTALVGANGTGKSTLLKVLAGSESLDYGSLQRTRGMSIGYLPQEGLALCGRSVFAECLSVFAELRDMEQELEFLSTRLAEVDPDTAEYAAAADRFSHLDSHFRTHNGYALDAQVGAVLGGLGFSKHDWSRQTEEFSGGWQMRIALAKLLLQKPSLLLLDEPTNHLDAESVLWLEQHLEKYPGTVIAITHDRYFLENVAQWILELDRGHAYPYEGNYTTYLQTKANRLKVEGAKDAKMRKRLDDELEWVRSSARARQTKSRARLDRYEEMAAEADRNKKLDFEEIQIPPGPRLGNTVVEVEHLVKGFGDRVLYDDLSFSLPKNGIVGVIGPNGVGKTTLFKMIVGEEKPDSGTIRIGDTVKISYSDQNRSRIDPAKNVWQAISDGETFIHVGNVEFPSRAYVAAFGFKGSDQQKLAGVMSGGERNRMNLALTLKQGGNLLLLDEPTNDLDVETLGSLENALLEFPGCAVITSHDRWFLDRVATHILAWEGGANWFWFEGNFESYEKNKIERLGAEAAKPHRVTYRKLTRG
jgi:ATP-binding cassette ChvD family protein